MDTNRGWLELVHGSVVMIKTAEAVGACDSTLATKSVVFYETSISVQAGLGQIELIVCSGKKHLPWI